MRNPTGFIDPLGLAGYCCNELLKQDRLRRHQSSSAEYLKHTKAKTKEEAITLSSNGGSAQYWGDNLPSNANSQQLTAFRNTVEKDALRNGTEINLGDNKGSFYYIHDAGTNIGFNNGKPTQYLRVKVTNSPKPEFHGHPISLNDYNTYMRSKQ